MGDYGALKSCCCAFTLCWICKDVVMIISFLLGSVVTTESSGCGFRYAKLVVYHRRSRKHVLESASSGPARSWSKVEHQFGTRKGAAVLENLRTSPVEKGPLQLLAYTDTEHLRKLGVNALPCTGAHL